MNLNFDELWKRIAAIDSSPTKTIDANCPDARDIIVAHLSEFAFGRELTVDSQIVDPRPKSFRDANDAVNAHRQIEFIATVDGKSFWAITEEEHAWNIYVESPRHTGEE